MHVCPVAAKIPATAPLTALSRFASAKTMLGDFPPSSRLTPFDVLGRSRVEVGPGAIRARERDLSNQSVLDERLPRLRPNPVTTFTTPFGNPPARRA